MNSARGTSACRELILDDVRRVWPGLSFDTTRFLRFVEERTSMGDVRTSGSSSWSDLYLACACAEGASTAIRAFDRHFRGQILAQVRGSQSESFPVEDFVQSLYQRLFVQDDDARPKIETYTGRGTLRAWLRVVVARALIDCGRVTPAEKYELHVEQQILDRLAVLTEHPERSSIGMQHRECLRRATHQAIRSLEPRARELLRQNVVHGCSIDQLASLHSVHRATAARWLVSAKRSVLSMTRSCLQREAGLSVDSAESVLRNMSSQWDLSLERVLGESSRM